MGQLSGYYDLDSTCQETALIINVIFMQVKLCQLSLTRLLIMTKYQLSYVHMKERVQNILSFY